jgi:Kdo2-lipid IVA lauroyltransferase/acyltransferase
VGVPIIPAYIRRTKEDKHIITVLPELPLLPETDDKEFMVINTQRQIDWIAEILLEHPSEWLWLHNRWKRAKN